MFVGFVGEYKHECMRHQVCRACVSAIDLDLKVQIFVQPRGAHLVREGLHAIEVRPDPGKVDSGVSNPARVRWVPRKSDQHFLDSRQK